MLNYSTLQTLIQLVRMVADIGILWILLFYTIKIVRNNTRTAQIFKGIILILIIKAIANYFGFKAVDWLAGVLVTYGFLAIIIIFQPEIRTILERLGKNTFFSRLSTLSGSERERLVDELVSATMNLSSNRVGALITLEQGVSLNDFIKTGTPINSLVNAELLNTIFLPNTPIHDGAVIIQGDRIACASAYFPPTNMIVPTRFGARHRAAIGISEITDSITIVVSEKSGRVSIAEEGKLVPVNQTELRNFLKQIILHGEEEVTAESTKRIIPEAPDDSPEVIHEDSMPENRGFFKRLFSPNPNIKPNQKVVEAEEKAVAEAKVKKEADKQAKEETEKLEAEKKRKAEEDAKLKAEKEAEEKAQAEAAAKLQVEKEAEEKAKAEEAEKMAEDKLKIAEAAKEKEEKAEKAKTDKEAELKAKAEAKADKPGFFAKLFGAKPVEKVEEVVEEKVEEEKKSTKKKSTTTKKKSTSTTKKATSTKKKTAPKKEEVKTEDVKDEVEEVIVEEDIEPIKDTPHVNLEYSVSDDSLLDEDDFNDESKGGE